MLIRRGLDLHLLFFPSCHQKCRQPFPADDPRTPAFPFSSRPKSRHPRAHSAVAPPLPMPNRVVKRGSANGTWMAASWKSRSARGFFLSFPSVPCWLSAAPIFRGSSSAGRALPCQGRCRAFESRLPLQITLLALNSRSGPACVEPTRRYLSPPGPRTKRATNCRSVCSSLKVMGLNWPS